MDATTRHLCWSMRGLSLLASWRGSQFLSRSPSRFALKVPPSPIRPIDRAVRACSLDGHPHHRPSSPRTSRPNRIDERFCVIRINWHRSEDEIDARRIVVGLWYTWSAHTRKAKTELIINCRLNNPRVRFEGSCNSIPVEIPILSSERKKSRNKF